MSNIFVKKIYTVAVDFEQIFMVPFIIMIQTPLSASAVQVNLMVNVGHSVPPQHVSIVAVSLLAC